MKSTTQSMSWVVYQTAHPKFPKGAKAVCKQSEWDAMQLVQPSHLTLVQAGIPNEAEAERLARSEPVAIQDKDIRLRQTLLDVVSEAGLDRSQAEIALDSDEGMQAISEANEQARQVAVEGVPFFITNSKTT